MAAQDNESRCEWSWGAFVMFVSFLALFLGLAIYAWFDPLTAIPSLIVSLLILGLPTIACAIRLLAPFVREWEEGRTISWLVSAGHHSRHAQEREARWLLRALREETEPHSQTLLKGELWWEVVDIDHQGKRLLVRPLFDRRLRALIGEDPVSGEPFFMAVPPETWNVDRSLEWIWSLEYGFWSRREDIYET